MSNENDQDKTSKFEEINKLKQSIKENIDSLKKEINVSLKSFQNKIGTISSIERVLKTTTNSFLDYYGSFPSINNEVRTKISIDKSNLITSITKFFKDIDLEIMFFYISILKMLEVDLVENFMDNALEIIEKQTHNSVFTALDIQAPDPINNFYGLAILSELRNFEEIEFINLQKIKEYIQLELNFFNPNALYNNYFLLNCVNLLKKRGYLIDLQKEEILQKLSNLELSKIENYNVISDTFYYLCSLILLSPNGELEELREKYIQILKDFTSAVNLKQLTFTELSQLLLILDLLNIKDKEAELVIELLNEIINTTPFFNSDDQNKKPYWKEDLISFKIELEMLFWGLLAVLEYQELI
jgi:hypothetical protein